MTNAYICEPESNTLPAVLNQCIATSFQIESQWITTTSNIIRRRHVRVRTARYIAKGAPV